MLRPFLHTFLTLLVLLFIFPAVGASSWVTLLVAAVVLTLFSQLLKPILKLLFLPINVITLGFFSSVINIFLLWFTTVLVPGFTINPVSLFGYELPYILTLLLVSALLGFIHPLIRALV